MTGLRTFKSTGLPLRSLQLSTHRTYRNEAFGMWRKRDTKHFFCEPKEAVDDSVNSEILQSYRRMQSKRRLQTGLIIISSLLITILGYQVCYKVLYQKRDAFIAVGPSPYKIHKLTPEEAKYLDIPFLKKFIKTKVMEKVIRNEFVKEQYGVPLKFDAIHDSSREQFKIWSEDEDIVIYGLKLKPHSPTNRQALSTWHNFFGLFDWRICARSINLPQILDSIMRGVGIGMDRITIPEKEYGQFKHESPINDDDEFDKDGNYLTRRRHICFVGELALDDNSSITYKGKYHVTARFDEVFLMRNENGKHVKYVIYNKRDDPKAH